MPQKLVKPQSKSLSPKPKRTYTKKSKGLGDTIEAITEATGIKAIVDKVSELTGIPCGCEERKETLNALFPRHKEMTVEQVVKWESIQDQIAENRINPTGKEIIQSLYNDLHFINRTIRSCSSCAKQMVDAIERIYQDTCPKTKQASQQ